MGNEIEEARPLEALVLQTDAEDDGASRRQVEPGVAKINHRAEQRLARLGEIFGQQLQHKHHRLFVTNNVLPDFRLPSRTGNGEGLAQAVPERLDAQRAANRGQRILLDPHPPGFQTEKLPQRLVPHSRQIPGVIFKLVAVNYTNERTPVALPLMAAQGIDQRLLLFAPIAEVRQQRAIGSQQIAGLRPGDHPSRSQLFDRALDANDNLSEGFVAPGRARDRLAGKLLNFSERRALPNTGAQDDGNDNGFARVVTLEGALHLDFIAIIRGYEILADQQQNDVGGFQVIVNRARPIVASDDPSVVPDGDHSLPPQDAEVSVQFLSPLVVAVGI